MKIVKNASRFVIAGALLAQASIADEPAKTVTAPAAPPTTVTVTDSITVPKPVSPELVSSFFELAFGRSDLVMAEMLYDRGFELDPKATMNSCNGWCQYVKPKKEMEDWWHSGYEENRWYLAKSNDDKKSEMRRTGVILSTPNGKSYLIVHNKSEKDSVSLAQDGVWVNKGMTYQFSGLLTVNTKGSNVPDSATPTPVEICLFPEGKTDGTPLATAVIQCNAMIFRKFTATLNVGDYTGRTTFAMRIGPGKMIACDMLSLMPSDNICGLRKDALEMMKQVPASVIRYPGGCYASSWKWREGIGDRDTRRPDYEHLWNLPSLHDFGTVEFLTLCKEIGSEPMMCVPVMCEDEYNAADLVAFCNIDNHSLHAKAGIKRAPVKVKYWELDNEMYRQLDATTYAHRCVAFSKAMKKVDPDIKIIMGCYWIFNARLKEMLAIAGPHIDMVNNRGGNIAELRNDIAVLAEYNKAHGTEITLCHSEYRANSYDLPVDPNPLKVADDGLNAPKGKDEKDSMVAKASRWSYGLSVLCDFMEYQGFGGGFQFANFTGYNDGWGEGLFNCAKSKVYPSAVGQALTFLRRQKMAWPLACKVNAASPILRTQIAWDLEKKNLIILVLNLSNAPRTVTWDISGIKDVQPGSAKVESLAAPSPKVSVTENAPNPIIAATATLNHDGKTITYTLQPYSATAIQLTN